MAETQQQTNDAAKVRNAKIGIVESDQRDKTRRVVVQYSAQHPKYGKYVRKRTVLQVHDEDNACNVGDRVMVAPCRPISKTKSWKLVSIIERAPQNVAADLDAPKLDKD